MKSPRVRTVSAVLLLLTMPVLGRASATAALQLEATVEPLAGQLQVALEDPGVVRTEKWAKVTAELTNETGVALHGIEVVLRADSGILDVRDGATRVAKDLKPGAFTTAKWTVRSDQEGLFVIMATARATTTGDNRIVAESAGVVLEVVAKTVSP